MKVREKLTRSSFYFPAAIAMIVGYIIAWTTDADFGRSMTLLIGNPVGFVTGMWIILDADMKDTP